MDKQTQILATALKLFVRFGFHGTPTARIAEEAGVANGTLFHYYKTKDELVVGLYNSIRSEFSAAITKIIHADDFMAVRFKKMFVASVHWALDNPDKYFYLQQFQLSPHVYKIPPEKLKEQSSIQSQLIADAIHKRLLIQQPPELVFNIYNGQVMAVYQYLTSFELEEDEQRKMINRVYELMWEMLKYNG